MLKLYHFLFKYCDLTFTIALSKPSTFMVFLHYLVEHQRPIILTSVTASVLSIIQKIKSLVHNDIDSLFL